MSFPEGVSFPETNFDAAGLKTLSPAMLSEALLAEAVNAANSAVLTDKQRTRVEGWLIAARWMPTEVGPETQTPLSGVADQTLGLRTTESMESMTPKDTEVGENDQWRSPEIVGPKLVEIDRVIEQLNNGLQRGLDEKGEPWTEDHTLFLLQQICEGKSEIGVKFDYATDFVRQAATQLPNPGRRGVVLLHNALDGDGISYKAGLAAFREGVHEGNLDWRETYAGLEIVRRLMEGSESTKHQELREMAIDLLAVLREQARVFPWRTASYAVINARLVPVIRQQAVPEG